MMEPFRISASQVSLYAMCPRKYKYQYIEDRPRPEQPSALAFGSAIHAAIEWAQRQLRIRDEVEVQQVIQIFRADMEAQATGDPPLVFQKKESLEELLVLGKTLLPLALRELLKSEPAAVEDPFEVALPNERLRDGTPVHLTGILDRIEQDGSIVEIKTSKKRYSQADVAQNLQVSAYTLAQGLRTGQLPSARLLVLLKGPRPDVVWYETRRTRVELAWFKRLLGETARAIDRCIFPPRISWACLTCEYRRQCRKEGVSSKTTARPRKSESVLVGV